MDDFDQGQFEDEVWQSPGVLGVLAAILVIVVVLIAGSLVDKSNLHSFLKALVDG